MRDAGLCGKGCTNKISRPTSCLAKITESEQIHHVNAVAKVTVDTCGRSWITDSNLEPQKELFFMIWTAHGQSSHGQFASAPLTAHDLQHHASVWRLKKIERRAFFIRFHGSLERAVWDPELSAQESSAPAVLTSSTMLRNKHWGS